MHAYDALRRFFDADASLFYDAACTAATL